jgi:hypothetical protein
MPDSDQAGNLKEYNFQKLILKCIFRMGDPRLMKLWTSMPKELPKINLKIQF